MILFFCRHTGWPITSGNETFFRRRGGCCTCCGGLLRIFVHTRLHYDIVHKMPGQYGHVYRNPVAPPEFLSAAEQAMKNVLLNRLQQARARILHNAQSTQSAAIYAADLQEFNNQLEFVRLRFGFVSFENERIDCCMTHVTTVHDPVAYIELND